MSKAINDQARATVTRKSDYLIGKLNIMGQLLRQRAAAMTTMLEMYNKFSSQYIDATTYAE